jgi:hypothetical protein
MRTRGTASIIWVGAALLAAGLAACGQKEEQASAPQVEEKTIAVTPGTASVKASFLAGELQEMKVTERVEKGTGKVVDPPKLRATLKLKNASENRAARLISGKVEYADAEGKAIPLAEGRGDTSFKFYSYGPDRLDPGMETSQSIEVPFPAAALKDKKLKDIRLELGYIPAPYKEETVHIQVSLGK